MWGIINQQGIYYNCVLEEHLHGRPWGEVLYGDDDGALYAAAEKQYFSLKGTNYYYHYGSFFRPDRLSISPPPSHAEQRHSVAAVVVTIALSKFIFS